MSTSSSKLTPAAIGADRAAHVTAVLVAVLTVAEREYAQGGAGPTARAALAYSGFYSSEILSAARRAHRRVPDMAADMAVLPATLELGRRIAAERMGGAA